MVMMGQNLWEALTRSFVTPKQAWYVLTMYRGGTAAQIAREMEGYQLDILDISECWWTGAGKMKLDTGQMVIYGGDEEMHDGGIPS